MKLNAEASSDIPNKVPLGKGSQIGADQNAIAGENPLGDTSWEESQESDSQLPSNIDAGEKNELYRLAVELVEDYAIFMLDLQGNVVSWNKGATRIKGSLADEVVGQNFAIFYPSEDCERGKPQAEMAAAVRDGRIEDEGWRIRKDGTRFWANIVITSLHDKEGRLKGFSKIIRDVTDRMRVKEALEKSEQSARDRVAEMEAILDNMPIPIYFAHDPAGLHITANRTGEELLRISRGAEVSLSAPEGVRPTHFKPFRAGRELSSDEMPTQRAVQGITVRDFDFDLVFDDDTRLKMLSYAVPLWDESDRPRGAITVLVEITKRMQTEMALRKTEERLRLALEALKIGTFEIDLTSGEEVWNTVEFELLGLKPGDAPASAETFLRFVHAEDVESVRRKWELAKQNGEYEAEFRLVRADGQERWLAGKGRFSCESDHQEKTQRADGQSARFLGLNFDITERKQAELALRESETQFRAFFENAGVGLAQIDATGQFCRVNDVFCEISGYSREQLLGGMRPMDLDHPDDREIDQGRIAQFISGEMPVYDFEKRYLRPNGQVVWVHVTGTACRNPQGVLQYSAAVISDITERRRIERAVHENTERLRSILNTAADAIVVFDLNGIIDTVNPNAEKMFGYSSNEMIGLNIKRLLPPPFQERYDRFLHQYQQDSRPPIIGIRRKGIGVRKDGSTLPIDLNMNSVDHLGLFTAVVRDITERQRLEKHVLEIAAQEQRRIAQELHDGTQQELAGMSMLAEVIVNLLQQTAQKKIAETNDWMIDHNVHKQLTDISSKLCQRLSDARKHVRDLSHGLMPVQIDAEGLRSALEQLATSTNGLDEVTCRFDMQGTVAVENATTATHLYRIAQESLHNAIRHGKANVIEISMRTQDACLILEIRDNGVGFNPVNLSPNAVDGHPQGMGLRIMEYRARMIGGSLVVRRQETGGMCVKCEVQLGKLATNDGRFQVNDQSVDDRQMTFW